MREWIQTLWYGRRASIGTRAARAILTPLSIVFRLGVTLRGWMYAAGWLRVRRVDAPVVIVGNLTVGGSGKTPLVAWLAQRLGATFKVGILLRGYGGTAHGPVQVGPQTSWEEVGDEARLLASLTGADVVVARDRVAGAERLAALGANLILCDDGLQHLRLARECEIVVVDGQRGFGNGALLPKGPLREGISRLKTVDVIVVNGEGGARGRIGERPQPVLTMHLTPLRVESVSGREPPLSLDWLRGRSVHAVAGLGNPARFFATLRELGAQVREHPLPDHHRYAASDLEFGDTVPVVMSAKDAVKCRSIARENCWFLPVEADFEPEAADALVDVITHSVRR